MRSIRDPVHGFVHLTEAEVKLLDSRPLQRLRGIRQLAFANLVYPGALHTRFDHSIGVTHVAASLADALELKTEDAELVRLAAILHDIGHGPFSHVSELALERYAKRDRLPENLRREKIHEIVTAHLIRTDRQIDRCLGRDRCDQVAQLLLEGHGEPVLRSIVSGPLDADKQDYLLRDSRFCGVEYGVFDIHQLHRSLTIGGMEGEKQLMIDPDGVHAVEQYVLAKYYMTRNVYCHRVRLITDQMITRAIVVGCERDEIPSLRDLYTLDDPDEFVARYMEWDDARLLESFAGEAAKTKGKCYDMFSRLRQRRLLKRIFRCRLRELREDVRETVLGLAAAGDDARRSQVEAGVAEVLGELTRQKIDPDFVIAHAYDIRSVREASGDDEGGILVDRRPSPRAFDQESALFASIDAGYVDGYLEIYAPVAWGTRAEREKLVNRSFHPVREVIESQASESKGRTDENI